jgi:serine/threonine protein kinase
MSLDNHLFGNGKTLPWNVRYKIALGLASALHYLHEEAENCVLHRDIKSANVLLDADFNIKGDFGVAELVDPELKNHRTGVVGTCGYLAPEYASEGRASKASDVFSFGVVALEIACGRKTYQDGEFHVSLVRWIWQLYLVGDILNAADERLSLCMSFNQDQMERFLIVGLWCTHPNYKKRPKTAQVIKVLQLEAPLPELPRDMHHPFFQSISPPQGQLDSFQPSITSSLNYGGR